MSQDPYCYPNSHVLKNNLGIEISAELRSREYKYAGAHAIRLKKEFRKTNPVLNHEFYKNLHKEMFQDLYKWAGKYRTIDMSKEGNSFSTNKHLERTMSDSIGILIDRNFLKDKKDRFDFVREAALHYNSFNVHHPFREGNGRTNQLYFEELGRQAGYDIDFKKVPKHVYHHAVKEGFNGNLEPLAKCFNQITRELPKEIEKPGKTQDNVKTQKKSLIEKLKRGFLPIPPKSATRLIEDSV